MTRLIASKV